MANNWYTQLVSISKTNEEAARHLETLKNARTEGEKANAKAEAEAFIKGLEQPEKTVIKGSDDMPEMIIPEKPAQQPKVIDPNTIIPTVEKKEAPKTEAKTEKFDPEAPALKEKYRRWGLNREEELFIDKGICLREMKRPERIKFRTAINQKKNAYYSALQSEWQKKQQEQIQRDLNDPEKIKYNHQRTMVTRIVDELREHHNILHIMKTVPEMTPAIMLELLQKPENVNQFTVLDKDFVKTFYAIYGEQLKTKTNND